MMFASAFALPFNLPAVVTVNTLSFSFSSLPFSIFVSCKHEYMSCTEQYNGNYKNNCFKAIGHTGNNWSFVKRMASDMDSTKNKLYMILGKGSCTVVLSRFTQ